MNRFLKTLLLWLLIAALPVQGMAAAMKMSCAPDHHMLMPDHAAIQAINVQEFNVHEVNGRVSDHASSHFDNVMHEHHAHGHHSADMEQAAKINDAKDSTSYAKVKSVSCSACAACCIGAVAPPSASIQTPDSSLSDTVLISPAYWVAGYIPPSLERPPRYFLI